MAFFDLREPVSAWSHCLGLLLAPPGILLLWRRSGGDHAKRLSLLVYGLSLAFCYTASTLYMASASRRTGSPPSTSWTTSGSSP